MTMLVASVTVVADVEDPSASRAGVADHLAVIQGNWPPGMDIWPIPKPLAMPPPSPPAVLLFTRLLLRVRTPLPGKPGLALRFPPPEATGPCPAAVLWFTSEVLRVITPWLTMRSPAGINRRVAIDLGAIEHGDAPIGDATRSDRRTGHRPRLRYRCGGRVAVHLAGIDGHRTVAGSTAAHAGAHPIVPGRKVARIAGWGPV
jgi:hypothetical protein